MTTPNYDIDPNDSRLVGVEAEEKAALTENEKTYDNMIEGSGEYYQKQIDAARDYANTQKANQQAQTDFAIEQINQQKEQAKQDYTKEQSGAYVDWQKQSNQYGANAEAMAAQGMQNTGYSESSQVSMYNTYQNRVATARESYVRIVQDFDNAITEARLQNNSALAEIAYKSLQQRLELNLQGFQYKNQLLLEQANRKTELEQMYHERWQDVLDQMNTENALAEEIRQYNESMAFEREQFEYQKAQAAAKSSGGGGSSSSSTGTPKIADTKTLPKVDMNSKNASLPSASDIIAQNRTTSQNNLLNTAIAKGASKDAVANSISLGLRNGTITQSEANRLRETFTPRGVQY